MKQTKYNLIQVTTDDQIKLSGLYVEGSKEKEAVIFIHGFTTDFFTHDFYHTIAKQLEDQGNAIILAQNRGTGVQTEFLKSDHEGIFIGSYLERLEDAHHDISAFIDFLQSEGYSKIVVSGHSLGTIKSVRYLFEGRYKDIVSKLILVSPFDKNAYMELKVPGKMPEFVAHAEKMVKEGRGEEFVPVPQYEDFAISWNTYLSWYKDDELGQMWDIYRSDYDFPTLQKINVPVKVILGSKDEFMSYPTLGVTPEKALQVIEKHIPDAETALIDGANHVFNGFEEKVGKVFGGYVR